MRLRLLTCLLLACALRAQDPPLVVNPNRPTFATPALTTQSGQIELEWGGQQSLYREDGSTFGTPTLLKIGWAKDLEFRLATPGFQRLANQGPEPVSGLGDTNLGVQWCYRHDGLFGMDQAIQINHTFPTASYPKGLGNGTASDGLILLFSRDLGLYHVDVNALESWLGRPPGTGGGRVRQPAATVCLNRSLSDAWSLTGELYTIGGTELNPRIVSNLWAFGYKVSPACVLDGGVDIGLTRGAPVRTVFAGLTVALGRFRHAR